MKSFLCLTLFLVFSFSNLCAQQVQKNNLGNEVNIWGFSVPTDYQGNFIETDEFGRTIKFNYDTNTKIIRYVVFYDRNMQELNGTYTTCTKKALPSSSTQSVGYVGYSGENKQERITSFFYDKDNLKKINHNSLCSEYGDRTTTSYVNGVMEGSYYSKSRAHGGTCDWTQIIKGEYKDNKKHGLWTDETMLDCGGLMDTWFDFLNGSKHTLTKITYDNGIEINRTVNEI